MSDVRARLVRYSAVALLVAAGTAGSGFERKHVAPVLESLRYKCLDHSYLSVSAALREHDSFLPIDLRLTDPLGRSAGSGNNERQIPSSQYGRVVEMPKYPDRSKAIAVEVCNPIEGRYEVRIWEHMDRVEYVLAVRADNGKLGNLTVVTYPISELGRTCRFAFKLGMTDKDVTLWWLDEAGEALRIGQTPPCMVVQQT